MRLFRAMILCLVVVSCSPRSDNGAGPVEAANVDTTTLCLPVVPASITNVNERADYIALHYWDNLDFANSAAALDTAFVEQNFVEYLSVLPYATSVGRVGDSFTNLLRKARVNNEALDLILYTADKYLDTADSPMRSEEIYAVYLESLLGLDILTPAQRARKAYRLEMAGINRPGDRANDFRFTTLEGHDISLGSFVAAANRDVMLVFFDPDCDHCARVLDQLAASPRIESEIKSGKISVLAIYCGDDKQLWQQKAAQMPRTWTVGINPGDIIENDLYYLPSLPSIYIIGKDEIVKEKDITIAF